MVEFGQTPRETIAEAFEKAINPSGRSFRIKDATWLLRLSESDLLNLLDVLADSVDGSYPHRQWARDLRISILARLGLLEGRDG